MIDKTHNEQVVSAWFGANGDNTHRLDYPLTPDSIVLDIGGYKGDYAAEISNKFKCFIHVFEPMKDAARYIGNRAKNNSKVFVHPVGVGSKTEDITIYIPKGKDEATMYPGDTEVAKEEQIKVIDIAEVFKVLDVDRIDLMKLNIEGAEFDLLDRLIKKGLHKKVTDIQIQFHKIADDSVTRRDKIREKLSKTHECTWDYPFVWENWKLK